MGKFTFVVDAVQAVSKPAFEPLKPGEYVGVIKDARETTIRNGRHAGKKSIDVAVQMEDGRYIWKVLPQFTPAQFKKLTEGDRKWYELSTVSFVVANKIADGADVESFIDMEVKVLVGMHQDNGYGPQNSIVKFLKK